MSTISSLTYVLEQVSIYFGITILVSGMLGGLLNLIIFFSLRTFRQSSCTFYLIIMSIVNIGQLFSGLFSRIMINGFLIDWTQSSLSYCKIRYFILQTCSLISCTCICLAIIDQYFATCSYPYLQQWCRLKVAYCLIIIFSILWSLHGILYLIFFDHIKSSLTNQIICSVGNPVFSIYSSYVYLFTLTGILPVSITILFSILVYKNIRELSYRTVPIVRRELDKQLTRMVFFQVIVNFLTVLPYLILNIIILNIKTTVLLQFIQTLLIYLYYLNYASPFYVYISVSSRFRRQLIYVLRKLSQQRTNNENQIAPE